MQTGCFLQMNFWLCRVFVAAHGLSLVVVSRDYFPLWWLLSLWSAGSGALRLQQLSSTVSVALQHTGSSWTRDQKHVPCIGRQILIHCTTMEVLRLSLMPALGSELRSPIDCRSNSFITQAMIDPWPYSTYFSRYWDYSRSKARPMSYWVNGEDI